MTSEDFSCNLKKSYYILPFIFFAIFRFPFFLFLFYSIKLLIYFSHLNYRKCVDKLQSQNAELLCHYCIDKITNNLLNFLLTNIYENIHTYNNILNVYLWLYIFNAHILYIIPPATQKKKFQFFFNFDQTFLLILSREL